MIAILPKSRPFASPMMRSTAVLRALLGGFLAATCGLAQPAGRVTAQGAEPSAEDTQFFESKIRPILVENCHRCHGDKKQNGKLRLDSLAAMLAGGESGPAITPGKPKESLLI